MMQMSQKMSLQLKQSPQQVLLSTLLQLPVLRLEQRIRMELETNPLLEEDLETEEIQEPEQTLELETDDKGDYEEEPEIDWEMVLNDDSYDYKIPRDEGAEGFEKPNVSPVTLSEHLLNQLHLTRLSPKEIEIGEYIIWNIDEDGYLSCPVETIAENLGVSAEEVERVLKVIQSFEPAGIAARDLKECLLIQLRENGKSKTAIKIIENHFDDFKNKRFEKIAADMDISLSKVKKACEEISKMDPKPGEGHFTPAENYIVPDMIVEKVDGDFVVTLNDSNIPRLRINNTYKKLLLDKKNIPRETKEYIKKRLEQARWLINSIHQRRDTMIKVMKAIIKKQRDFFDKGEGHLKPMVLKDIADEIGMDISTVSRVTSGKYVQTDHGVYELRYFFSEGIKSVDGKEISNRRIKERIKEIIANEPPKNPLNDQQIADILKKEGINLARRTIAKYREEMRIPIARLRRKI